MPFNFQRLEHARIALALVAAVITGGAALYGVYSNAREATAASYETLAPEINELKQAVARLEAENQTLHQALAAKDIKVTPAPARPAPASEARSAPRRPRASPSGPTAPKTEQPTQGVPDPVPPTAPAEPPAPAPAPSSPGGVLGDIQKRVPIDFEKAREVWKKVKDVKKP